MRSFACLILWLMLPGVGGYTCKAQNDTLTGTKPFWTITAFGDFFYAYDFNEPTEEKRLPFLYNHNRHNKPAVNLALANINLQQKRYRVALGLQAGTYATDNYAAENEGLKYIHQANAGFALNKKSKLWIDAGILPSHIGFESAISIDNPTLTRSLAAENSPYFETGIRLSYAHNTHWEIAALVLNGWQRIAWINGNSLPSFGTHLQFKNEKMLLSWNAFAGTDDPDSTRRMRYFSNLFAQVPIGEKWFFVIGYDIGLQQKQKGSKQMHVWQTPVGIMQYRASPKWQSALRFEYYNDPGGVIVQSGTNKGFGTTGLSFNCDYAPRKWIVLRTEGRWLQNRTPIYETQNGLSRNNVSVTTSVALRFVQFFPR